MTPDEILKELLSLEKDVKPKLKRIGMIREWCKEQGTFSTLNYVCAVTPRQRTCLVSLEKAIEALGREMLESFDMIQTISFEIVNVSERSLIKEVDSEASIELL